MRNPASVYPFNHGENYYPAKAGTRTILLRLQFTPSEKIENSFVGLCDIDYLSRQKSVDRT